MFKRGTLKQKLREKSLTLGAWITLPNTSIAEIFANAGFDWVVIDLEHSTITIDQTGELIRVIDLSGVSPLVRLTSNNSDLIKRVMDAGAHGIIVPNICSAEEARYAVSSTRYFPKGSRGVGLARAQGYGNSFHDYIEWQSDGPVVIVQIENASALDNLESIFSVEGVDAFMIGPYDLSCSMGYPGEFNHIEFVEAKNKILKTAKKVGCISGYHVVEPDISILNSVVEEGFLFIAYSLDSKILDVGARKVFNYKK